MFNSIRQAPIGRRGTGHANSGIKPPLLMVDPERVDRSGVIIAGAMYGSEHRTSNVER
jgi:hypothetical protein